MAMVLYEMLARVIDQPGSDPLLFQMKQSIQKLKQLMNRVKPRITKAMDL